MISDIPQIFIYKNLFSSDKYFPLPKIGANIYLHLTIYSVSRAIH